LFWESAPRMPIQGCNGTTQRASGHWGCVSRLLSDRSVWFGFVFSDSTRVWQYVHNADYCNLIDLYRRFGGTYSPPYYPWRLCHVSDYLTAHMLHSTKVSKSGWRYPCDRPWLRDDEAPTFSRQSAHRWRWGQPYTPNHPCDRSWRPTGFWDVKAPTFSRHSAHRWR
jgi:hypothetical protein